MKISLTSFVDFVLKSGSAKVTCARLIKERMEGSYDVATDYYKRFREGVIELHQDARPKEDLIKIVGNLPHGKEVNYKLMMNGYRKFLGTKKVTWFAPKKAIWTQGTLQVSINPEVGLEWEGTKSVIKLYTKNEKPSKDRVASVLALMYETLKTEQTRIGLLDVRNAKLYEYEQSMNIMNRLAESEALSLSHLLK